MTLAVLMGGCWVLFVKSGGEIKFKTAQVAALQELGDLDGQIPQLEGQIQTLVGQRIFNGILLAFLSAGFLGLVFVFEILPSFAQRLTLSLIHISEPTRPY